MDLNVSTSLTNSIPDTIQDGKLNFVKFSPINGASAYSPGDTINIKVSSNTEFLCLDRSYLRFDLNTNAVGHLNPMGASACFQTVQELIGGLQLPTSRDWYIKNSIKLNTDTYERQNITENCELFTVDSITGITTGTAGNYHCVMPVPTSLVTDKLIPLAFLNAGIQFSYGLNSASNVVDSGVYSVSNIQLVACMITPESAYLEEISNGLNKGGSLKIPLELYKGIPYSISTATSQMFTISTGYLSSINNIVAVNKESNAFVNSIKTKEFSLK
jgi:hypothetical protein